MSAYLEVVEGPDAGRQQPLDGEVTIGRGEESDFVLVDPHSSRKHCQVTPVNGKAIVRDLGSSNGTFVNHQEVVDQAELEPGDDLLVGVSVLELRGVQGDPVARDQSGVVLVPDALRVPERTPDYVPPALAEEDKPKEKDITETLNPYLDVKIKRRTRLAPLFLLLLAAAFVVVFQITEGLGSVPSFDIDW
jgi:pSer/pThr/pTyr-binding forkhead associated (FHA) protein